jgi:hypothetical protein
LCCLVLLLVQFGCRGMCQQYIVTTPAAAAAAA